MKKLNKYLKFRGAIYRLAAEEIDEGQMVSELEDDPAANWREYLQPIIRTLKQQLGSQVTLLGPRLESLPGGPQVAGFDIAGHIKFPEGRPDEILQSFGEDSPVPFRAFIHPDGKLTHPVEIEGLEA